LAAEPVTTVALTLVVTVKGAVGTVNPLLPIDKYTVIEPDEAVLMRVVVADVVCDGGVVPGEVLPAVMLMWRLPSKLELL